MHYGKEYVDFLNEVQLEPPLPTKFKVGDLVTYVNDEGFVFPNYRIVGFSKPNDILNGDGFIYLDKSSYWFPVSNDDLIKQHRYIGPCPKEHLDKSIFTDYNSLIMSQASFITDQSFMGVATTMHLKANFL